MRYFEIARISEATEGRSRAEQKARIIKRLQQLDQRRIEAIALVAHRELRSQFLSVDDLERFDLEQAMENLG
jgi:hypothetical protein